MRTYTFHAGDKAYTLKYTFNEICDIEEQAGGIGIQNLVNGDRVGMNTLRLIIWGGLKWKMHGLTKQEAGNIIKKYIEDGNDITDLLKTATELMVESANLGSKKPEDEDESEPTEGE